MTTKWMRLVTAGTAALVLAAGFASGADLQPAIVASLRRLCISSSRCRSGRATNVESDHARYRRTPRVHAG